MGGISLVIGGGRAQSHSAASQVFVQWGQGFIYNGQGLPAPNTSPVPLVHPILLTQIELSAAPSGCSGQSPLARLTYVQPIERRQSNFPPSNSIDSSKSPRGLNIWLLQTKDHFVCVHHSRKAGSALPHPCLHCSVPSACTYQHCLAHRCVRWSFPCCVHEVASAEHFTEETGLGFSHARDSLARD